VRLFLEVGVVEVMDFAVGDCWFLVHDVKIRKIIME
jgi:hypothetical protein